MRYKISFKSITFFLLITSLFLYGCHMTEDKVEMSSSEENINVKSNEEYEINTKISLMEKIIESSIYDHTFTRTENDEWIIYECEPLEGGIYELDGTSFIHLKKTIQVDVNSYEDVGTIMGELGDYHTIWHFVNPENEYGITEMYEAVAGEVGIPDKRCYLIYLDGDLFLINVEGEIVLNTTMFSNLSYYNDFSEKYRKQVVECGKEKTSTIIGMINNESNIATYEIYYDNHEKADLMLELLIEENLYTLKINQNQKEIQQLKWESDGIKVYPQFIDVNIDGYVDMALITKQGIANNEKDLYIWESKSNCFNKVIYCGENFLSNIEVKDNYIWNWIDNGVTGYTLEILEWNGIELRPISSEIYEPEESNG